MSVQQEAGASSHFLHTMWWTISWVGVVTSLAGPPGDLIVMTRLKLTYGLNKKQVNYCKQNSIQTPHELATRRVFVTKQEGTYLLGLFMP